MLISRLSQYMNDNNQNHIVLSVGQDFVNGDGENTTRVGGNTNQVRGNANPVGGNNNTVEGNTNEVAFANGRWNL